MAEKIEKRMKVSGVVAVILALVLIIAGLFFAFKSVEVDYKLVGETKSNVLPIVETIFSEKCTTVVRTISHVNGSVSYFTATVCTNIPIEKTEYMTFTWIEYQKKTFMPYYPWLMILGMVVFVIGATCLIYVLKTLFEK